ncbi:MAG: BamA/TamA family outer membrane protein, partial [candidate division WOR-3 bacterium]
VSYTYEGADLYEALIYEVKEVRRIHLGTWLGIHWEEGGAKTEFSEVQIEWRESTYLPQTPPIVAKLSPMDVYWLDFSELGVDTDGDGFKEAIVEVSVPSMPENRWMDIFLSTHYGRGKIDATLITPTPINFEKKEWDYNIIFRIPNVLSGTYRVIVEEKEKNSLVRIVVPIYEIRDNLITPISGIGTTAKWNGMDIIPAFDEKGFSPAIWEISPQVITVNPGEEFDLRINFTIRQLTYHPPVIWQVFLLYSWSPTWPPTEDYYVTLYDSIPFYERFFLGDVGPYGLRGYELRSVGPRENGINIGGRIYFILTLEQRYRINDNMYVLAFFDAGNAFKNVNTLRPFIVKKGIGAGIRMEIPLMGVIGFDFAYGIDSKKWIPHIQLGTSF